MEVLSSLRSDAELVRKALADSPWACEALVFRYQRSARAVARAAGVEPSSADDVVQEAFLRGFRQLAGLREPASFGPWFLAIVRNLAKSHLRGAGRVCILEDLEAVESREPETLEGKEFREALWRKVAELPEGIREAVFLYYHEGESVRAVARALGTSPSAAKARLKRGRGILRARLWRELGTQLRDMLPSAREWRKSGRRLTLIAMGALASSWARAAGEAAATLTSSAPVHSVLAKPILGGVTMISGKKLAVGASLAVVLLMGGIALMIGKPGSKGDRPPPGPGASSKALRAVSRGETIRGEAEPVEPPRLEPEAAEAGQLSIAGRIISNGRGVAGARVFGIDVVAWEAIAKDEALPLGAKPIDGLERLREAYLLEAASVPETVSEGDGSFGFGNLPDGVYRILAEREGFLPSSTTMVGVRAGTTARCEIELIPALPVTGRAVDPSGNPVPGASIEAQTREIAVLQGREHLERMRADWLEGRILFEPTSVETGPDGGFRLGSLEPTIYDLIARKEGYLEGRSFHVPAGSRDVILTLHEGCSLEGRVLDSTGSPVRDAEVGLSAAATAEVHRLFDWRHVDFGLLQEEKRASTGETGRFRIQGLVPGSFTLLVTADGFPPLEREITVTHRSGDLGDLLLEIPRVISGAVRTPGGDPFPGARVWVPRPRSMVLPSNRVAPAETEAIAESRSEADGGFLLGALPDGILEVRASADGYADGVAKGVPAGTAQVDLVLQAGITVHGKVIHGDTSDPVADAEVVIGYGGEKRTRSDPRGAFRVPGFALSDLRGWKTAVRASHPEFGTFTDYNAFMLGRTQGSPLVLPLSRAERIAGRVSDSEGQPIMGAQVRIEVSGLPAEARGYNPARDSRAITGSNGSFSVAAPTDLRHMIGDITYHVVAFHPAAGRDRAGPLELPRTGDPWPDVDLRLGGSVIGGKVTGEDGSPIPQARVSVRRTGPTEDAERWPTGSTFEGGTAYSGPNGEYRLMGVEHGPCEVTATALGFAPRRIPALTAGEEPLGVDIVLSRGGSVEGTVRDTEGDPVAQAEVLALPEEELTSESPGEISEYTGRLMLLSTAGLVSARTGPDGSFRLAGVPDGTLRIVARAPGYETGTAPGIRAGTTGVDLTLSRFAAVYGTVLTSRTREPIPRFAIDILDRKKLPTPGKAPTNVPTSYRVASEGQLIFDHPAGRFLYDGLRPGDYLVVVQAPGSLFATREVALRAGEERSLEILLDWGDRIDGVVVDEETGLPVAGVPVGFSRMSPGEDAQRFSSPWGDGGLTAADGTFSITGLREGKYLIMAVHPYYLRTIPIPVEIPRSNEEALEIKLAPAGRLEGRILGSAHQFGKSAVRYSVYLKRKGVQEDMADPGSMEPEDLLRIMESFCPVPIDPEGRYHADSLRPGVVLVELKRQVIERGEVEHHGPAGGTVGSRSAGPEDRIPLGEVEIRPRQTTIFDAVVPGDSAGAR